ncbi:fatty acid desaturase [Paenibacillus yanchengensis]|uniref:Fatty acid desaturase n=1 Tax=Paenibacillus yanchengensis TaxID=2035833 RepID=A0ABW4YJG0_9BACL
MSDTNKQAQLRKTVAPYEKSNLNASVRQILNTIVPLVLLWTAAYLSLSVSYWLTLLFAVLTSGFVIRTFIIFHDCCHGSFFRKKKANDILGIITGVITHVPYEQWKNSHSMHHATSSNLDKRGIGDIWMMTVEEYAAASWMQKFYYRAYRNPLVMFGLGPIAIFAIQYRFNRKGARKKERLNTHLMNILLVTLYAVLMLTLGWKEVLLVQLPVFYVSAALGIWLFYVQHTFEDSYFEHDEEWNYVMAAVEGSSYYKLPRLLQWLTGNIGFHHVHHLSPRVPNYHLEAAHNNTPPLQKATTITMWQSFAGIRFKLWDEMERKFITFRDFKKQVKRQAEQIKKVNDPLKAS